MALCDGVQCGTEYELYLEGVNSAGPGRPSSHLTVQTAGQVPAGPPAPLAPLNTTMLALNLRQLLSLTRLHILTYQDAFISVT